MVLELSPKLTQNQTHIYMNSIFLIIVWCMLHSKQLSEKEIPKAWYKLLGIFIVYYAYECMPARK